jgi:hypothetical protein
MIYQTFAVDIVSVPRWRQVLKEPDQHTLKLVDRNWSAQFKTHFQTSWKNTISTQLRDLLRAACQPRWENNVERTRSARIEFHCKQQVTHVNVAWSPHIETQRTQQVKRVEKHNNRTHCNSRHTTYEACWQNTISTLKIIANIIWNWQKEHDQHTWERHHASY